MSDRGTATTLPTSLTVGQTETLLLLLEHGAAAISFGIGSGGNPPGPDVYLVKANGQVVWIRPDGSLDRV